MAAAVDSRWVRRKRRAVQSVFPTSSFSQPTPSSTPALPSLSQPGQPFGGPPSVPGPGPVPAATPPYPAEDRWADNSGATQQTRFDRSWHLVTARIALPPSVTVEDSFGSLPPLDSQQQYSGDDDNGSDHTFQEALLDVLDPTGRLPLAAQTDDLLAWHTQQVRLHFTSHVLPLLEAVCNGGRHGAGAGSKGKDEELSVATQVLLGCIRTLEAAHRQYFYGLSLVIRGAEQVVGMSVDRALWKFRRDLHAIVGNSMPTVLMDALRKVQSHLMMSVLGVTDMVSSRRTTTRTESYERDVAVEDARKKLLQLVDSLYKVGLAGERFQVLFAELLDSIMASYVQQSFANMWNPAREEPTWPLATTQPSSASSTPRCIKELSDWVENHFARLAVEVTNKLGDLRVSWNDVEKWKEIAVGRLAALRIRELFDIVVNWPESEGGVDDLRWAVTTPQRRLQLTDAFSADLERRLLHPGRSTLDILRTYIAMIRAFRRLDNSRVLLDRVSYSLQLYLCTRDDTVRIIVNGLLASPDEENDPEARRSKLIELVQLLRDSSQQQTAEYQDEDWDDLTWVPPPVDAGSNYKRRRSEDVIGTLIGALGSPEVFIKEFQNIIGQRLLSGQDRFEQEIRVLNLLKKRFGDAPLQGCDVMIKDIQDSRRLDGVIHRTIAKRRQQDQGGNRLGGDSLDISTRILSRLFWPDMGEERFGLPDTVVEMQKTYEEYFEALKTQRKVKWLNHLGQATVELELADRTITEVVRTYEAAVIYAFADGADGSSTSFTFEELWMKLEMDEDLLTAALDLWESKRVLRRSGPEDRYCVVERLSDLGGGEQDSAATQQQQQHQDSTAAGGETSADHPSATTTTSRRPQKAGGGGSGGPSEKEKAQQQVYWQFIVGMLTNSSPTMPLGQIAMMMKMLIADGFPWSNEELQEFLGEKVTAGELELAGGKYRLVKK